MTQLCRICREPAIENERYCYPCYDEIAEMTAEYDSNDVSDLLAEFDGEPDSDYTDDYMEY